MKRVARLLGLLGGVAAVVWAMRDRFISLTIPREPEPPVFRPPPAAKPVPDAIQKPSPVKDDLTEVNGVGPVYAQRLQEAGVSTFAGLAAMSEDELAAALGSSLGKIPDMLEDARRLAGG